jgi:hypothetical protein
VGHDEVAEDDSTVTGHLINTDAEKQTQRKYNVINECHALDADSLRTPAGVGCTSTTLADFERRGIPKSVFQ